MKKLPGRIDPGRPDFNLNDGGGTPSIVLDHFVRERNKSFCVRPAELCCVSHAAANQTDSISHRRRRRYLMDEKDAEKTLSLLGRLPAAAL